MGDHVFLVGGDDHDRDGGTGGADDLRAVAHGLAVLVVVDAHAQPLKAVAEGLADRPIVLADAGGKGNGVHARHGGNHGTCLLHGLVGKHVEGEQAALVALGGARADVAGVVGNARDGKQTGLLVHHVVDFLVAVAALALQVAHGGRVDGTATGAHHQAVERCEAHRGIAAHTVLDSGERSAVAQVAGKQTVAARAQNLLGHHPLVTVARAVGAVLAHVVLVAHVLGQRIGVGDLGHGHVERRIENSHVGQLRIFLAAILNCCGLTVVVQRSKRRHLKDLGHDLIVDDRGIIEVPAALNDTVADAVDRKVSLLELLEHARNGRAMVGEGNLLGLLGTTVLGVAKDAHFRANALAVTLSENLASIGVQKLIFKARAAGVDNKYVHETPS